VVVVDVVVVRRLLPPTEHPLPFQPVTAPSRSRSSPATDFKKQPVYHERHHHHQ